jgi:hypothetical protein
LDIKRTEPGSELSGSCQELEQRVILKMFQYNIFMHYFPSNSSRWREIMKKLISAALGLLFVIILASCGSNSEKAEDQVIGKTFIYEGEGLLGDDFTITFNEDYTFSYSEGTASSHLGYGTWSVEGTVITLVEPGMDAEMKNRFEINDNQITWLEEDSTNFIYVQLKDGEVFRAEE